MPDNFHSKASETRPQPWDWSDRYHHSWR